MKKVYCHHDRFMVFQAKQILEEHGIPCFIKNEYAIGGIGELSPFDSTPEVWLSDEEWFPKAHSLLTLISASENAKEEEWNCQQCDETNDGHFELCWQCGIKLWEQ